MSPHEGEVGGGTPTPLPLEVVAQENREELAKEVLGGSRQQGALRGSLWAAGQPDRVWLAPIPDAGYSAILAMVRMIGLIVCALAILVYLDRPSNDAAHTRRRAAQQIELDNLTGSFDDEWVPSLDTAGDHGWVLSRTVGILSMQGGFALLEAGSVRPANKANIMMKNVADLSVSLVGYAIIGYSLSFASGNAFIGGVSRSFLLNAEDEYTTVLHQFSFAATTGTIVSGAVAERMKFKAYLLVTISLTNVLYAACCHWVWHPEGWLLKRSFIDFAGAGVVHMLGGVCALVATLVIGPRFGRFGALPPILVWLTNQKFAARKRLARLGCFRLVGCFRLYAHRLKEASTSMAGNVTARPSTTSVQVPAAAEA